MMINLNYSSLEKGRFSLYGVEEYNEMMDKISLFKQKMQLTV